MTWLPVPSLSPLVEASDEGLVRIIPYPSPMPYGGTRMYGGKPRRGCWDGDRYVINIKGLRYTFKVARLVCEAFHGPPPLGKPCVLHRDENPRNNRPENLMWGTQKENLNAPGFLVYCRSRTGKNHPRRKAL
jgi:HNH endonuclease